MSDAALPDPAAPRSPVRWLVVGVLIAALIVKQLPLLWLRWLVVIVVLYAAIAMLRAAKVRD